MKLTIPSDFDFAQLKLTRDPVTLKITCDLKPLQMILEDSCIDPEHFSISQDQLSEIIVLLYKAHKAKGGTADPVVEQIIAEAEAKAVHSNDRVQRTPGNLE